MALSFQTVIILHFWWITKNVYRWNIVRVSCVCVCVFGACGKLNENFRANHLTNSVALRKFTPNYRRVWMYGRKVFECKYFHASSLMSVWKVLRIIHSHGVVFMLVELHWHRDIVRALLYRVHENIHASMNKTHNMNAMWTVVFERTPCVLFDSNEKMRTLFRVAQMEHKCLVFANWAHERCIQCTMCTVHDPIHRTSSSSWMQMRECVGATYVRRYVRTCFNIKFKKSN